LRVATFYELSGILVLGKEMNDSTEHPDAVIIGLKTTLDQSVPEKYLNQLNDVDYPVF